MKKVIFIIGLFISSAVTAQNGTETKPQGYGRNRYDANGNVIGRDSVIVYNWSSNGGDNQSSPEDIQKMFDGINFSFGFDGGSPFGNNFGFGSPRRDSTYQSPFDDFFGNNYDPFANMPSMQEMIEKQQRMMEELQKQYNTQPSTPLPPTTKDDKEEKKKNQKRKSISI